MNDGASSQDRKNHLGDSTSPYLQQHAYQPVDWFPWCDEALEKAQREKKPIFLSVGYSACHWCHVMAHESFEDEQIAAVLNENFVCIKVDREERPDLDKIYQTSHQLLARRPGGWPLTVFLSPGNLLPFFTGTYFPKSPKFGLPGFGELLQQVLTFFQTHSQDIATQNESLQKVLTELSQASNEKAHALDKTPFEEILPRLNKLYDPRYGGFGEAPKFPQPSFLDYLLQRYALTARAGKADKDALHMACYSLRRMAQGGIYDQIGGGFARYSVDEQWMIPHFEKMLYDNAQLLTLYTQAWQITGDQLFERIARETADWLLSNMRSPEGGFYASVDADSQGEEGKYYVWDEAEVKAILSADEFAVFTQRFGLDDEPNFEGQWHLYVYNTITELSKNLHKPRERIIGLLESSQKKLLAARQDRTPPAIDDKVLTAWNALVIKALTIAGRSLNEPRYLDAAEQALQFLHKTLYQDGRLLVSYKDGQAALNAYLDDYAFLLDAVLEHLQSRWQSEHCQFAIELAENLIGHFCDTKRGGFFFTSDDHEPLIQRPRPLNDEAIPSGNAIATRALFKLGSLLGEPRYLEACEQSLHSAFNHMRKDPVAHASMTLASIDWLLPAETLIISGPANELVDWSQRLHQRFRAFQQSYVIPGDSENLPSALASKLSATAIAYRCQALSCDNPVTDLEALLL